MSIARFDFTRTHDWNDHPVVKKAQDELKASTVNLPGLREPMGQAFTVSDLDRKLGEVKTAREQQLAGRKTACDQGMDHSVLERYDDTLASLKRYGDALTTIRNYMTSYQACGC